MSMCGEPNYYEEEEENAPVPVYTDVLSKIKTPDYNKVKFISPKDDMKKYDFKKSYSALRVKFNFPPEIKYPPLPVQLDKNITIYPSSGETLITGLEFLSAMNILKQSLFNISTTQFIKYKDLQNKYFIDVIYGTYIPFKKDGYNSFYEVINELQSNRRIHRKLNEKGYAMERIYKDLGNMLYGKVVCGISNKRQYNSRLEQMTTLKGNFIANPIIGT